MSIISKVGLETIAIEDIVPHHGVEGSVVSFDSVGHKITDHTKNIFKEKDTQNNLIRHFILPDTETAGSATTKNFSKNLSIVADIIGSRVNSNPKTDEIFIKAHNELKDLDQNIELIRNGVLSLREG